MNPKVTGSNVFLAFYYKDFPIYRQTNLSFGLQDFFFPIKKLFFFLFLFHSKKTLEFFSF